MNKKNFIYEEKNFLEEVSARLKELRKVLGFTQEEISRDLGISKSTYVRYEASQMMPKIAVIGVLHNKYDVNINWFFSGKGNMFVDKTFYEVLGRFTIEDYAKLLEYMQVPEIERAVLGELEKAKKIFKSEIEEFYAKHPEIKTDE